MEKLCSSCGITKSVSDFHLSRASRDGLVAICKPCACAKTTAWKAENAAYVKARDHARYCNEKDLAKARAKAWGKRNKDRVTEFKKAWAQANPEKRNAAARRRRAANLELAREQGRRAQAIRRARESRTGGMITEESWNALIDLFETRVCLYCGKAPVKLVMDHFIPVSRGGPTELGNLLPCCHSCNSSKGNRPPAEWVVKKCGRSGYEELTRFLAITSDRP